jgi:ribonuclease HI
MPGWRKRRFRKADGKLVANLDLVIELDHLLQQPQVKCVKWVHMNSHRKEPDDKSSVLWRDWYGNSAADRLANEACAK